MLKLFIKPSFVFLPFIIGIILYKYLNKGLRFIFLQICFWVFTEILLIILISTGHQNLWYLHIYVPIEFLIFALTYAWFLKELIKPKYIYAVAVIFISCSVVNTLFFQNIQLFNSYVRAVGALLYVCFAILYFYKLLFELKVQKLRKEPMVWINTGILIYYSAIFFLDILSNKIIQYSIDLAKDVMFIRPIFYWIFNILAAVGFLIARKNAQETG